MNIVEILKERKQILKLSAIALVGAAAVYMLPAHMSSAMVNGEDDGEPIESSQMGKEDTDNVDESGSQQTTLEELDAEIAKEKAELAKLQEQLARLQAQFEDEEETEVLDQSTVASEDDTSSEKCIEDDHLTDAKTDVTDESQIEFVSDQQVSVYGGKRRLICYENDGEWQIDFTDNDFTTIQACTFDVREEFGCKDFLNEAAIDLVKLGDLFSVVGFVSSKPGLSLKGIDIRGKGKLRLYKNEDCSWSISFMDDDLKDFYSFDISEDFDVKKFFNDAMDKFMELGEDFSLKDFFSSNTSWILQTEGTKAKEIEFSLKLIKGLPTSEEELRKLSELPNESDLNEHDRKVYEDIKEVIKKLKEDVERDTSAKSEQMKKANAVYCWVANNIDYNHIKDQDAFSVFECKNGVCRGVSYLINLMMRMMEIPSLYIGTLDDRSERAGHAYNAIYVDGGWTLMDATWAHQKTCQYNKYFFDSRKADLKNDISDKLNDSFIDLLYDANTKENSGLVYDYGESIKREIVRVISENKDMVESDMKKVDDAMSEILDKVNPMYESLNKIAKIKLELDSEDKAFSMYPSDRFLSRLRLRIDLSESAKKYINDVNGEKLRIYFPAYYLDMSFDDANRKMVSLENHSIHSFVIGIREDDAFNPYVDSMKYENGLVYFLDGYEGNAKLCLRGGEDQSLENVIIPEEIFDYGFPVEVGINIQSLVLKGYEKSFQASNLKNIDATQSDSHIVEDGILYEKKDGKKGDIICAFNAYREVKGMMCHIRTSEDGKKIEKVFLASSEGILDVGILPPEIIKYEAPIMISSGIRSFKVTGDTIIELVGSDIEAIDASESSRYIVEDGVLYEKDTDGNKGAQVAVFNQKVDKGAYKYFVKSSDAILICGNETSPLKDFHIPEDLIKQYGYIEIGLGIESLILKGDDIVSFCKAKDLKKVDIRESNIYIKVEGKLCKHGKFSSHPTDLPEGVEIID